MNSETLYHIIRFLVITMSFVAMWALWRSYDLRHHLWTHKMRDIWASLFLYTFACAAGNIELLYRGQKPTIALAIIVYTLYRVIRGCLSEEPYTKVPQN